MNLPSHVTLVDVGPRDGLQNERQPVSTAHKAQLVALLQEAGLKEIDREVKVIVTEAAEFSQSSPEPDPSELWTDVLIEA